MPNLGYFHPQVVHFVIALGLVGILLRLLSLGFRNSWLNPAAAALLIFTAGAGVVAARSGTDAHGPAERVPGARESVQEHEEWGERTRNILLLLGALEVVGLVLAARPAARLVRLASAAVGLAAGYFIYETGEHGGELVYEYAGGVGIRSGKPADVNNLLVAALYHNIRLARDSGRTGEANRLTTELVRLRPTDPVVRMMGVESRLRDLKDPAGALAELEAMRIMVPADDPRLAPRYGLLMAEVLEAAGQPDRARALLEELAGRFPQHQGIKAALEKLPRPGGGPGASAGRPA